MAINSQKYLRKYRAMIKLLFQNTPMGSSIGTFPVVQNLLKSDNHQYYKT